MSLKVYLVGAALLVAAFFGYCYQAAQAPDETLVFTRDVPSDLAPAVLASRLSSVNEWAKWFYSAADVKIIDSSNHPLPDSQQIAKTGSTVRLAIDPKKGEHRKFEIAVKIREFIPEKKLDLQVLDDSKGMLFKQFDQIEWTVEVSPAPRGFLIHGTEVAHTASWRSRVFGKIATRILMHQIFYPDLMKLAESHPPVMPSED